MGVKVAWADALITGSSPLPQVTAVVTGPPGRKVTSKLFREFRRQSFHSFKMGRLTLALGSFLIPTVLGMYTAYHPWVSPLTYQLPGPLGLQPLQPPLHTSLLRSGQIQNNNGWDTNIMGNR